jgi:hypothetical protein
VQPHAVKGDDVNPPVHAYATMQIYLTDKERNDGKGDLEFLTYAFSKLLVNFVRETMYSRAASWVWTI